MCFILTLKNDRLLVCKRRVFRGHDPETSNQIAYLRIECLILSVYSESWVTNRVNLRSVAEQVYT